MRVRRVVAGLLVVLASSAVLAASLAVWATRTAFDTDRFTAVVGDAIGDPVVIDALSTYLTDQVVQLVNADGVIEAVLPPALNRLAPILVGGARTRVEEGVSALLASDAGQEVMLATVRRAHRAAMRLLEGDGLFSDGITVADGTVTLNTLPLIDRILHTLQDERVISPDRELPTLSVDGAPSGQLQQLAARFGTELPPDFGQLTVYESDMLAKRGEAASRAQQALVVLKRGVGLLLIVAVALIALALLVSVNRWRTVAQLGLGVTVAMLMTRVAIGRLLDIVPSRVASALAGGERPATSASETTRSLLRAVTGGLRALTVLLVVVGLILVAVAFLMGNSAIASRARAWLAAGAAAGVGERRSLSPAVAGHADGVRVAVGAIGVLMLLLGGLRWPSLALAAIAVIGGLVGVELARRAATRGRPLSSSVPGDRGSS